MEIIGKKQLEKLKRKNRGNLVLRQAIDALIHYLENNNWENKMQLIRLRPDVDCVYENFYFFNINVHRTLVFIEIENAEATIVWCGTHNAYTAIFRNNKDTIRKWLKEKEWI